MLYTLDPEGVQTMIDDAMITRKVKLENNQHLLVEMKPEFLEALDNCMNFSSKIELPLILYSNQGQVC